MHIPMTQTSLKILLETIFQKPFQYCYHTAFYVFLQVNENEILSRRFFSSENMKSHRDESGKYSEYCNTLIFQPKIALSKVLHGKKHCDNAKSSCPAEDLYFLIKALP
jgi:hypothetical protein